MKVQNNKFHIILTETAVELIPVSIRDKYFSQIQKSIKKLGNIAKVLDTALHHSYMSQLDNREKRGRPDILHKFLLDALGSPANHNGVLEIYFHLPETKDREEALYWVSSKMRTARDFLRFKGLITKLLENGQIPEKAPFLIEQVSDNFPEWLKENFSRKEIFKFSKNGTVKSLTSVFRPCIQDMELDSIDDPSEDEGAKYAILIGGFQKGSFSKEIQKIPGNVIALPDRGYDSWIVVQRVLGAIEQLLALI